MTGGQPFPESERREESEGQEGKGKTRGGGDGPNRDVYS